MKKEVFVTIALVLVASQVAGFSDPPPPSPTTAEAEAMMKAAVRYTHWRETNVLTTVEGFYIRFPNYSGLALGSLKVDEHTIPMMVRLLKASPVSNSISPVLIRRLSAAPESEEIVKIYVETALNQRESEDARLAAIFGLMNSKWTKAQPALAEIFLKVGDEKYHERMLDVAIYKESRPLAEVFLAYYYHFHPDKKATYATHYARFHEMQAKLAEDAKNPQPDPLALIRAQREWWDNFLKKERRITLAEAKAGLEGFAKAPVLERLELAYAIHQSVVPDAELLKRLEHLVSDEPSGIIKSTLINIIGAYQLNTQAMLQYYRRIAAKEKDAEVLVNVQARIKLIEDGVLKR